MLYEEEAASLSELFLGAAQPAAVVLTGAALLAIFVALAGPYIEILKNGKA